MLISDIPKEDRSQILAGCVIKHTKYGWGWVTDVFDDVLTLCQISSGKIFAVSVKENECTLPLPRLGYINIKGHVVHASRIPRRIMKGGICLQNLTFLCPFYNREIISKDGLIRSLKGFPKEFIHMFEGIYPPFDECSKAILENGATAMAFDRQFAIASNGIVYYKGKENVGTWNRAGITFIPKYEFLNIMIGDGCGKALQSLKQAPKTRTSGD